MAETLRRTDAVFTKQIAHCSRHDIRREDECFLLVHVARTQDFPQSLSEGVASFLEKRKPAWLN